MKADLQFFEAERGLRDEIAAQTAERLGADYSSREWARFQVCEPDPNLFSMRIGAGSAGCAALYWSLSNLQELVMPGFFREGPAPAPGKIDLPAEVARSADYFYQILLSYYAIEFEEPKSRQLAAHGALNLISRLPKIRERAAWNIFASLKDPAVWDAFVLRDEERTEELGRLSLLAEIDRAIRGRDRGLYLEFLRGHRFDYAYDYQIRLIQRSYPGWRSLLLHDVANALALGARAADGRPEAMPAPFLPRSISEYAATQYQTDLHPETEIGDANFIEHPHRGITTGQTGKIGIGCVIYPCTLGGVTDKVKARHPVIGDFVVIGTDVVILGLVQVGDRSVVGANTEIFGSVGLGEDVRMGMAVVAQTVNSKAGKLIFESGSSVGNEALIINDHPTDLVIPANSHIAPHQHVVNDGSGRPKSL